MSSSTFDRLLTILEGTSLRYFARSALETHCRNMGREPDALRPEDAPMAILNLMADVANLLSPDEWIALDQKLKSFMAENEELVVHGKVKGEVINLVRAYLLVKLGKNRVEHLWDRLGLPSTLKLEVWYPLGLLVEVLQAVEQSAKEGTKRARDMGQQLITERRGLRARTWDPQEDHALSEMIQDFGEHFNLEAFAVVDLPDGIKVSYTGIPCEHFAAFFTGMVEGIGRKRNLKMRVERAMPRDDIDQCVFTITQEVL